MEPVNYSQDASQIAASRVKGTAVYNPAGDRLGSIYDVMIDKRSGQVTYAIMSFGGFLGIGDSYHPLPWSVLKYDTGLGGYAVNLDKQTLEGAPYYEAGEAPNWQDRAYEKKVHDYYGADPYWTNMP
jgi:sporulation protein YlmC with PRC-barrel domain